MAKRAKTKKGAGARPEAAPKTEPFFRPFAKLKGPPKKKKAEPASPAPAPAARPKRTAKPLAPPPSREPDGGAHAPIDPETFAIYMAGVRALERRSDRIPLTASRIERAARDAAIEDLDAPARARMRSLVTDGIRFETLDDGDVLEGRRLDVDPRDLRRLRRGQYAVDGKLDLHGFGLEDARQAVEAFVKKRATDGDRVVVIVHGKGSHSPRGVAVLRGEIAAWLSQGRSSRHIAAFATAPEDLGGTGAVLVLLAR